METSPFIQSDEMGIKINLRYLLKMGKWGAAKRFLNGWNGAHYSSYIHSTDWNAGMMKDES